MRRCGEEAANFNPLPRKEGDRSEIGIGSPTLIISIHSLVKRETEEIVQFGHA